MLRVTHFMRLSLRGAHSVERLYEDVRQHLGPDIEVRICTNRYSSRGIFRRLYDSMRALKYQGEVSHVTGDVHYLTYFLDRRRTVLTILDCVTLERLKGIHRWLLWLLWYWLPEKRCSAIVAISEATRQQVLRHLRCDPGKVRVIHCNVSSEFRPAPRLFRNDRLRVLHIGTAQHKNLDRHAMALEGLNCELVVVGELSVEQCRTIRRHQLQYENHLNLSRAAMVDLYVNCDLLLFASTYEGFGLPIVEANAVGRPVITSNRWSMPEVAGNAACLVNPYDVASIRAGIERVVNNAEYREALIRNGFINVKRFEATRIAEQYAALYREIHANLQRPKLSGKLEPR